MDKNVSQKYVYSQLAIFQKTENIYFNLNDIFKKTTILCNLIRLFQCDAESNYLEQQYFNSQQQQHLPPSGSSTSSLPGGGIVYHPAPGPGPGGPGSGGGGQQPGGSSGPNQIDVVLSEVRCLTFCYNSTKPLHETTFIMFARVLV